MFRKKTIRSPNMRNGANGISLLNWIDDSPSTLSPKLWSALLTHLPSAQPIIFLLLLFIFLDTNFIIATPIMTIRDITAPIQKAKTIAEKPYLIPKSQPIPSASFPSPRPIHLPPETSQRK